MGMSKHFSEPEGSCFIGEHQYTLEELCEMDLEDRIVCSCGKRPKNKCIKESQHKTGKMCLKVEDSLFVNFRDTPNGGWAVDIDYQSDSWQKVLDDWSNFKTKETK
jgi:hypothetical protein